MQVWEHKKIMLRLIMAMPVNRLAETGGIQNGTESTSSRIEIFQSPQKLEPRITVTWNDTNDSQWAGTKDIRWTPPPPHPRPHFAATGPPSPFFGCQKCIPSAKVEETMHFFTFLSSHQMRVLLAQLCVQQSNSYSVGALGRACCHGHRKNSSLQKVGCCSTKSIYLSCTMSPTSSYLHTL